MKKQIKKFMKNKGVDLTQERDDRCIPLARNIAQIITANQEVKIGTNPSREKMIESADKTAKKILIYLQEQGARVYEVDYIFQLVAQIIETPKSIVVNSMNVHLMNCAKKHWGKDENEITFNDIDKLLKS